MLLNDWRADYNNVRPHSSLANDTPAEYAKTATGGKLHPEPLATEKLAAPIRLSSGRPVINSKMCDGVDRLWGKTNAGAERARYGAIRGAHQIVIGTISRGLRYRDTNCDFRPHRSFLLRAKPAPYILAPVHRTCRRVASYHTEHEPYW